MPDLLIRAIAPNVKTEIERRAKASGRSLSDEAKHLLRLGMNADNSASSYGPDAYDVFRAPFADALLTDEEHAEFTAAIDKARQWKWRSEAEGQ